MTRFHRLPRKLTIKTLFVIVAMFALVFSVCKIYIGLARKSKLCYAQYNIRASIENQENRSIANLRALLKTFSSIKPEDRSEDDRITIDYIENDILNRTRILDRNKIEKEAFLKVYNYPWLIMPQYQLGDWRVLR